MEEFEFTHEEYVALNLKNGWISCKESLPDSDGWYLTTEYHGVHKEYEVTMNRWKDGKWDAGGDPTAWQPLPDPYFLEEGSDHDPC